MANQDNIPVYDFDELWENYSDIDCELVPLSQRDVSIIMSSIRGALWSARWYGGQLRLRETGRSSDLETAFGYIQNLQRKLLMTGCLEGLIDAISALNDTVRLSSCCWESGVGLQQIGEGTYYGNEAPLSEPTAFGEGEEFATEAEWEDHKCEVANGIVNGIIGTLNGLSVTSLVGLGAASLVGLTVGIGLIFVPPLAVALAVLAAGLSVAFFSGLAGELDTNKDTLVCVIYQADSAVSAYDAVKSAIADFSVDLGVLEIQLGPIIDLIMQMAPIDTFNKLYTNVGLPAIPGDVVDCDSCGGCATNTVLWGTFDEVSGDFESEYDAGGHYRADILFNYNGSEYCGNTYTVDITELSGSPNNGGPLYGYRLYDQDSNLVYYSVSTPSPTPVSGVGRVLLLSTTANFTVNLDLTEDT